jgi:hypothetical protein
MTLERYIPRYAFICFRQQKYKNKMTFKTDIEQYFDALCRQHVEIRHSDTDKHFARLDVEEIITGIKTTLRYPYVALDKLEHDFSTPGGPITKRRQVAFTVVDEYRVEGDYDVINDTYSKCESIADDFLNRIAADARTIPSPFRNFDWNRIQVAEIPKDTVNRTVGVFVVIELPMPYDCKVNPQKWTENT